MKPLFALCFAGSLALNAALALRFLAPRAPARPAPSGIAAASVSAARGLSIDVNTWPNLRTDDLTALVARLRAGGFPPEMIRVIIGYQISEAFAARRAALEAVASSRPFWQNSSPDPQSRVALQQLGREQGKLLREILGDDADDDNPLRNLDRGWRLSHLPAEKAGPVRRVLREIDTQRMDILGTGTIMPAERDKLAALDREERAALAKILTPAEQLDYELRSSHTARSLHAELLAFHPTEDELRALFRLRQPFDDQWSPRWGNQFQSTEWQQTRGTAYHQLDAQIKAALGPERAAQYERAMDVAYQRTDRLVTRLGLPPQTPEQLWAIQIEFEGRATSVHRDSALSDDARNARLTALAYEANARVAPLLGGERGVEDYKENGGGWLQNLAPNPRPAPAK